jgi:hypothetical protein
VPRSEEAVGSLVSIEVIVLQIVGRATGNPGRELHAASLARTRITDFAVAAAARPSLPGLPRPRPLRNGSSGTPRPQPR